MKVRNKIIAFFSFTLFAMSAQENVLTIADRMPAFPEGMSAAIFYFQRNTAYPREARENGNYGRAIVQFIVDSTGKVKEPKILKSAGYKDLDAEAVRVISKMPDWTPGFNAGRLTNIHVNLPISFSMDGSSDRSRPDVLLPGRIVQSTELGTEEKDIINKTNKANFYYYQGVADADRGDFKSALKNFDESLANIPEFSDALFNKAVMHFNLKEKDKACEIWAKIRASKKDNETEVLHTKYCN